MALAADGRRVEVLIAEGAAEEQQFPDLDPDRGRVRAGGKFHGRRVKGNRCAG